MEELGVVDWDALQQLGQKAYTTVSAFAYDYEWPLRLFFITAGVLLLLWQARFMLKTRKKLYRLLRGKQMSRKDRQKQQKIIQADAIFNALDRLVEDGKSTAAEINKTLRAVHNFLDMPDLIPLKPLDIRGMTQEEADLLEGILRSKVQLRKLILSRKKATIPGPKPGEDAYHKVVTLDVTRRIGDGSRRRSNG